MAATVTGPIRDSQINNNLFVGELGFPDIQSAVNYATAEGGGFTVVIPQGYGGAETIASLNNGRTGTLLRDERNAQVQFYTWSGTAFVAQGIVTRGRPDFVPAGSTTLDFDPTGAGGDGRGDVIVTANPGRGLPAFQIVGQPTDGEATHTFLRADQHPIGLHPRIQMPQPLFITNSDEDLLLNLWVGQTHDVNGSKGMYIWAKPSQNSIDFQGETVGPGPVGGPNQHIRLNPFGGDVALGKNAGITEAGTLSMAGDIFTLGSLSVSQNAAITGSLDASSAEFNACEVDGSPVRTFANSPDAGGMIWPLDGIAVSGGDHWLPSINPASLTPYPPAGIPLSTGTAWGASINPASIPSYPPAGIPQSTGAAWGASISPSTLATYPGAGIAVSTGSAWGTPIAANRLAYLDQQNTFTASKQVMTGDLQAKAFISNGAADAANTHPGMAAMDFINGGARFLSWGASGPGLPQIAFSGYSGDASTYRDYIVCSVINTRLTTGFSTDLSVGGNATFNADIGTSNSKWKVSNFGDAMNIGGQAFNFANATPATSAGYFDFRTDYAMPRSYIDSWGELHINEHRTSAVTAIYGTLNVIGTKNFKVINPANNAEWLTHSTLEGPEVGVYYRGESATVDGSAWVNLPSYFEALTAAEGRTVLLTQIFEDESEEFAQLMCSRVTGGRFRVRSSIPAAKFCWEVKAIRNDVPPLEVITPVLPEDKRVKQVPSAPPMEPEVPVQPIVPEPTPRDEKMEE